MDFREWAGIQRSCEYKQQQGRLIFCTRLNAKCSHIHCPHQFPTANSSQADTPVSTGKSVNIHNASGTEGLNTLTPKQQEAFKLRQEGLSYQKIGERMGLTRERAYELFQKASQKLHFTPLTTRIPALTTNTLLTKRGLNTIRLHDDCISFQIGSHNIVTGKRIHWKNGTEHILIDNGIYQVRIFRKTATIQWHKGQDIWAKSPQEAINKANQRIKEALATFHYATIISPEKQIKRHYGLVGNNFATQKVKEGKKIIVYAEDGQVRHRIDESVRPAELDCEHIKTGKTDAEAWQRFMPKIDGGWDEQMQSIMQQLATRNFDMQTTMAQILEALRKIEERIR